MPAAKSLDELIFEIQSRPREAAFSPCAYYNRDGDALEVYLSPEAHIAERVNTLITVFVSSTDRDKVVGFVIKNIKKHFGPAGISNILFAHRRATVRMLLHGTLLVQDWVLQRRRRAAPPAPLPDRERRIREILDAEGDTEVVLPRERGLIAR